MAKKPPVRSLRPSDLARFAAQLERILALSRTTYDAVMVQFADLRRDIEELRLPIGSP